MENIEFESRDKRIAPFATFELSGDWYKDQIKRTSDSMALNKSNTQSNMKFSQSVPAF